MSTFCGLTGGVLSTCQSRKDAVGGVKIDFWIGDVNTLDTNQTLLNLDGSGNINALTFENYSGLYKFRGVKFGGNGTDDIQVDEDFNPFFPHTVTFKLYDATPTEIANLESMAYVDLFVVYETATGLFPIYGLPNGLSITSAPKSTGNQPGDSVARLLTLEGNQNFLRKIFSAGTSAESKTALETYEL